MLIRDQKIKMKWNAKNRKHYESILDEKDDKKYFWCGRGTEFIVSIEDLPLASQTIIKVKCDYCGESTDKYYVNYIRENENNSKHGVYKDSCKVCLPLKMREIHGTLDELDILETDESEVNLKKYTESLLISEFYRYKKEKGNYPKKTDLDGAEGFPSAEVYHRTWGSWNNFLKSIGILGDFGLYKEDEITIKEMYPNDNFTIREINDHLLEKKSIYEMQKIIKKLGLTERKLLIKREYDRNMNDIEVFHKSLIDLKEDVGKCPTAIDYDAYTKLNKLPSRRKAEKSLNKTFSVICNELFQLANKVSKSDDELMNDLSNLKHKLGRTPKANELKIHGLAEKKTYMRRFNMTYQELIESLGWELSSPKLKFKDEEELLADYERLYKELGRLPNHIDLKNCDYVCSRQTYNDKFGSFKAIWDILELPYDANQEISSGFVSLNKNNELCKSNAELEISNILINNNIHYLPELRYSDLDVNLNKKWKMDWYLPDLNLYVEYFGLYQETQLKRNTRLGRYSRKVKKKIEYCLNNNVKLIDLYKVDLENSYQGLIRKFLENGININ